MTNYEKRVTVRWGNLIWYLWLMERTRENTYLTGFSPHCRRCGPAHWAAEVLAGLASREMVLIVGQTVGRSASREAGGQQSAAWPCSGYLVRLSGPHVTVCSPMLHRGFACYAEKAMERSSGAAELQRDGWGRLTRCPLTHKADTQRLPAISRNFFLP